MKTKTKARKTRLKVKDAGGNRDPMLMPKDIWLEIVLSLEGDEDPDDFTADEKYEHQALWGELEGWDQLLGNHYSRQHHIRAVFSRVMHSHLDGGCPKLKAMRLLRQWFHTLPEAERRRILNGWRPDPSPRNPKERIDYLTKAAPTVYRVMEIHSTNRFRSEPTRMVSVNEMIDEGCQPVNVVIREGTTKEVVLAELESALDLVRERWEWMIDMKGCDFVKPLEVRPSPFADSGKKPADNRAAIERT